MRLLFYATGPDRRMQRLQQMMAKLRPVKTQLCPDVASLGNCLRRSGGEMTLAVLLTTSQEELQGVLALRSLLNDVPLILILPDADKDTVAKGHALAPRFLTDIECNFKDLYIVMDKMLEKYYRKGFM